MARRLTRQSRSFIVATVSVPAVDVTSSDFKATAYAYYARLRAESPVHPVKLPSFGQGIHYCLGAPLACP